MKETSFACQGKRGFFLYFGRKSKYGQNRDQTGLWLSAARAQVWLAIPGAGGYTGRADALRGAKGAGRANEIRF
jgi:hypothetical protein